MTDHADQRPDARALDAEPNWRAHARRLALALGFHRTDMHRASSRPCVTCQTSQYALEAYCADVELEELLSRPAADYEANDG